MVVDELKRCTVCGGFHMGAPESGGIKQQESWDCGVACLAYHTELTMEWWYQFGAPRKAMYPEEICQLLKEYGYAATVIPIRKKPTPRAGDILIVQVGNRLGGHCVYLADHKRVMDPTDGCFHHFDHYRFKIHWIISPGKLHGLGGQQ